MDRTPESSQSPGRAGVLAALAITVASCLAYSNSLSGVFVLDDIGAIVDNPTIRHLGNLAQVLHPPGGGLTVSGRPVLNLSLALTYAESGASPAGYHATNLAIHIGAALLLYCLLRRILARAGAAGGQAVAASAALLWAVHPLQTEAVTYVVQRAESLMGLFLLASFYAFVRLVEGARPVRWGVACVAAFALALGTKENAVALPPILLLYDVLLGAGGLARSLRARGPLYLSLAAAAVLEAGVLVPMSGRVAQMPLGAHGGAFAYLLTQPAAVLTYLRLALVPFPLVFEYGVVAPAPTPLLLIQLGLVAALIAGTVTAAARRPLAGFAAASFWLLLAPTSLVPGTTQMIVEHRMYLALAPILALGTCVAARRLRPAPFAGLVLAAAAAFSVLTWQRNQLYRDAAALWSDTVSRRPSNVLAQHNLATALARTPGRRTQAIEHYRAALELDPALPHAHGELGALLLEDPRTAGEAVEELRAEAARDPGSAEAQNELGRAVAMLGHPDQAVAAFAQALRLDPRSARAEANLAEALRSIPGQAEASLSHSLRAVALDPGYAQAHSGLGISYAMLGQPQAAESELRRALTLQPESAQLQYNLGVFLARQPGREGEAVASLRSAAALNPGFAPAHLALARIWGRDRARAREAELEFQAAAGDGTAAAHQAYGDWLLVTTGRTQDAIAQYEAALRIDPESVDAHHNLAAALLRIPGRESEAVPHLEFVVRVHPADTAALDSLEQLRALPRP